MAEAREGRGRLSSIDELPDEAQDDIVWACGELNARQKTQAIILEELNARLLIKGLGPISRSAFNRYSLKRAMADRRMSEARAIYSGLSSNFTPEKVGETDLILGEFIKLLVFEIVQRDAESQTADDAMRLARAYMETIKGQKASGERKRLASDMLEKADAAVAAVAEKRGLTGEAKDAILDALRSGIKA